MLKNYFLSTARTLWRHKGSSLINVLGLSVAFALILVVSLFVRKEYSYDRFHKNAGRIVQINQVTTQPGLASEGSVATPMGLGPKLLATSPLVESSCRRAWRNITVKQDQNSNLELAYCVDPSFFTMFDFPSLKGDPFAAMQDPSQIVLSSSCAEKYFGDQTAVGQTLTMQVGDEFHEYVVGAVVADPPAISSIQFQILINFEVLYSTIPRRYDEDYMWQYPETYLLLKKGITQDQFAKSLPSLIDSWGLQARYGETGIEFVSVPLTSMHLHSPYRNPLMVQSSPMYSVLMMVVGAVILLFAVVNYTILALARSLARSRQVVIHRVLGQNKSHLTFQIMLESTLTVLAALPIAYALTEVMLPLFNGFLSEDLALTMSWDFTLVVIVIALLTGIIAGLVPTFTLSRQSIQRGLRQGFRIGGRDRFSHALIFVQFVLTAMLIVTMGTVARQVDFFTNKDPGYSPQNVASYFIPELYGESSASFAERMALAFSTVPGVESVSYSSDPFGLPWSKLFFVDTEGTRHSLWSNRINETYLKTLGIHLAEGHNFDPNNSVDRHEGIIVNQALVREYGWEHPIGKQLPGKFGPLHVIGVVEDFHFLSKHHKIEPLVLFMDEKYLMEGVNDRIGYRQDPGFIQVKLAEKDQDVTLNRIATVWKREAGSVPMNHSFLDEILMYEYQAERSTSKMAGYATLLAAFLSVMGLYGMIRFATAKRQREIGVRRVCGASLLQIVRLLTGRLALIIIAANLIAWVPAYLMLAKWLGSFAYSTDIQLWLFPLTMVLSLTLGLIATAYHSLKAAATNPATVLRRE